MFRCKGLDRIIRNVNFKYIDGAWVAAITVCTNNLYKYNSPQIIPDVKNLELELDGDSVIITWDANNNFPTELQYRTDDGEWTTILIEAGIGEA